MPPWPLVPPPAPRVGKRLRLEVLGKRQGRGAFVQPLDMAGVAEQVVLQRVAAVAVLVIQLQTTVLGEASMAGGDQTKQRDRKAGAERWGRAARAPQGGGGGLDRTVRPPGHWPHVTTKHSKRGCPETSPGVSVNTHTHRIQDLGRKKRYKISQENVLQ